MTPSDVIARMRPGYAPMVLKGVLGRPKGILINLVVSYRDGRFYGSVPVALRDFRSEKNVDNVVRCHRRQMECNGIALNAWHDPVEQRRQSLA